MDTIRASLAIGTLTAKRQQTNRHMGAHSSGLMDHMDAMNAVTEIVAMIEHTMTETIARFVWVAAKQGSEVHKSQKMAPVAVRRYMSIHPSSSPLPSSDRECRAREAALLIRHWTANR